MLKKGIILLIIITFSNCSKNHSDYKNIDDLIEIIKTENNLNSYPELTIDGYEYNYEVLKGKIAIKKEDIGYFKFVQNNENGVLNLLTKLPDIEKSEFNKFYVELNNSKIDFYEFENIELKQIQKKIYLPAENFNEEKYDKYEKVILLFTH
jgi:hypothetical protein